MPSPKFDIRRVPSPTAITGEDRAGVRGDLKALLKPNSVEAADVSVERPAILINTVCYTWSGQKAANTASLSAKAQALHAYLIACARRDLATTNAFVVPLADAKAYLGVSRLDRLRGYLRELNETRVRYGFGKQSQGNEIEVPMLQCREALIHGKRFVSYCVPEPVRTAILKARSYTWLELAPFSRFASKYAARLYPMLALRAGMDFAEPLPLVFTPEDLASRLGWPFEPGKLRYSNFEARCLKPALADIKAHVRRFKVLAADVQHGDTRGNPVSQISITVSRSEKSLKETQRVSVSNRQRNTLQAELARRGFDMASEVPPETSLAQAATQLRMDIVEVALRWTNALTRARTYPLKAIGANENVTGAEILAVIEAKGVLAAFELWLTDPMDPPEDRWSSAADIQTSAGVDWDLPTPETAKVIRIAIDPAMPAAEVRRDVLSYLDTFGAWDGQELKTLRIEYAGGDVKDYSVAISGMNFGGIVHKFYDIIVDNEFLAA